MTDDKLFLFARPWKHIDWSVKLVAKQLVVELRKKIYKTGWWFQIFFIFIPIWGRFPIWLICFKWVETTNQKISGQLSLLQGLFLPFKQRPRVDKLQSWISCWRMLDRHWEWFYVFSRSGLLASNLFSRWGGSTDSIEEASRCGSIQGADALSQKRANYNNQFSPSRHPKLVVIVRESPPKTEKW